MVAKGVGLMLVEAIFPRRCFLCQGRAAEGLICRGCRGDLILNKKPCAICAEPMTTDSACSHHEALICRACQRNPPAFDHVFAPFLYTYPLKEIIHRFKEQHHLLLSRMLSDLLLTEAFNGLNTPKFKPDLIVPVPTHWRTRLQRGFNPAAVLADAIGRGINVPVAMTALHKQTFTPSQHLLNRRQRLKNLEQSSQVRTPKDIKGKHILVVDDVVTTGSTVGVIAALLRDNGAQSVQVWALARTPPKWQQ